MRFSRFCLHTGVLPWMDLCILAGRLHGVEKAVDGWGGEAEVEWTGGWLW